MASPHQDNLPRKNEVVIALDHPRNCDVLFFPANKNIRSEIITARSGPGAKPFMTEFNITPIPGERIHLDVNGKVGRIVDGLGDPSAVSIFESVKRSFLQATPPLPFADPPLPVEYRNLAEDDIWTWLYFMRQMVDGGYVNITKQGAQDGYVREVRSIARLIQGNLPDLATCLKSGKVKAPRYDPRIRGPIYIPVPEVYQDAKQSAELAEAGAAKK